MGRYGSTPMPMSPELLEKVDKDEIITCRPADLLNNEMESLRDSVKDFAKSEEDVLLCALFPKVAPDFIKKRDKVEEVKEITVDWVD